MLQVLIWVDAYEFTQLLEQKRQKENLCVSKIRPHQGPPSVHRVDHSQICAISHNRNLDCVWANILPSHLTGPASAKNNFANGTFITKETGQQSVTNFSQHYPTVRMDCYKYFAC